jgi:hypothetical protein
MIKKKKIILGGMNVSPGKHVKNAIVQDDIPRGDFP